MGFRALEGTRELKSSQMVWQVPATVPVNTQGKNHMSEEPPAYQGPVSESPQYLRIHNKNSETLKYLEKQ